MRFNRPIFVTTTALVLALAARAPAATFKFAAEQAIVTAVPGATVPVNIYLVEEGSPFIGTTGVDGQNGLFSFGFMLAQTGNASITSAAISSEFGLTAPLPSFPVSSLQLTGNRLSESFPPDHGPVPQEGRILLATIQLIVPASGASTFTIADDANLTSSTTVTYAFETLDDQIADGSFTIAVPEPSVGSLFTAAIALGLGRIRHRRS